MAVTIKSRPDTHTPGYNEQYYVLDSTNKAQANFHYVFDVTIDGETETYEVPARPDTGWGHFDISFHTKRYLATTFNKTIDEISTANNSIKKVDVVISEKYGTPPVTQSPSSASDDYYVWNAAYNLKDYVSFTYAASNTKLLSNAPVVTSQYVGTQPALNAMYDQRYMMVYWHRGFGTSAADRLNVKAYDTNLNLIQETVILNNYATVGANTERNLLYVNISPYGLDLIETNNPGDIVSKSNGAADIIPSNTKVYVCRFVSTIGTSVSEPMTVVINTFCSKYHKYKLHWLNRMQSYDWQVFNLVNREEQETERLSYKNNPLSLDSNDNMVYDLAKSDRPDYSIVNTDKITLNSDWLTEGEAIMLKDLYSSPDIKLEDEDGNLYSVKITDRSYPVPSKKNKKLFNLTVNLEFTHQNVRQVQ